MMHRHQRRRQRRVSAGPQEVHGGQHSGASKHAVIHTDLYHLNVLARLMPVPANNPQNGRLALRQIKQELVDGVFPY
jgi:hypothetical protein